jgi:ADP-ribose pyrophosphatase
MLIRSLGNLCSPLTIQKCIILAMAKRAQKKFRSSQENVELISSKLVYDGPVFQVFTDHVREGKHAGQRDVVRHTGSVVILAVDGVSPRKKSEPRVLLIKQYRYVTDSMLWELPAGRIDPGESMLTAAKRELLEETGFTARKWKRIFRFYASPGFLDETMDVFLATGLTAGKAQPEEDEQIEPRFFPLSRALRLVKTNSIRDAKTMCSLLWFGYNSAAGH